jgi:hypothetical protein
MIKCFAYIVVLLIFTPCSSSSEIINTSFNPFYYNLGVGLPFREKTNDTVPPKNSKKQEQEDKKKIKEVAKAKKQPKPEKIEPGDNQPATKPKQKPKRQRRPEGLERPPEIPRRNGN